MNQQFALLPIGIAVLVSPVQVFALESPSARITVGLSQRHLVLSVAQSSLSSTPLLEQGIQYLEQGQLNEAQTTLHNALIQVREEGDRHNECLTLIYISTVSLGLGQPTQAQEEGQQALTIAEELDNPNLIAKSLSSIGVVYALQGDYPTAIHIYQEALDLNTDDPSTNRQLWNRLGLTYSWQANYEQAIQAYEMALDFANFEGESEKIATTLGFLADAYAELESTDQAIDYYQRSLALTEVVSSQISYLTALGHLYLSNDQFTDAVEQYEQALTFVRQQSDRTQEYQLLNTLASAQLGLGQFTAARDNAIRSIDLAAAEQAHTFAMDAWSILGQAYSELNQVDKAITAHEQALTFARDIQDHQQVVLALTSLGILYQGNGRYLDAIDAFESVRELTTQTQESYGTLAENALAFLGQIHISLGDYRRAIAYFQESLTLAQQDTDVTNDIVAYQKIGDAYYASGQYEKAIEYYQQALTQAKTNGNQSQEVQALTNLVSGYRSLYQFMEARRYAEDAVRIARSINDPWIQGFALWELGNLQLISEDNQSIETFQTLVRLSDTPGSFPKTLAIRSLGEAHLTSGDVNRAVELFQQALTLDQQAQDIESQGHTLSDLGRAYQTMGDLNAAEDAFRQAVNHWESLRSNLGDRDDIKVSLLNRQRITYQNLQSVLIDQDKPLEALEIAERGRARALTDLLSQAAEYQGETNQLSNIQIIQAPTLSEIINIAQTQNATLVQYSETLEALYIWVIKPSGEIIFESVDIFNPGAILPTTGLQTSSPPSILSAAIAESRSASGLNLGRHSRVSLIAQFNQSLETLHELLIEPIEEHLPHDPDERVIFIPQGDLFQVAFPALRNREGEYLIQSHTVMTSPSIQTLNLTQTIRQSQLQSSERSVTMNNLIVGNPVMPILPGNETPLASLPNAEEEATIIAELLETSALTGVAATEPVITEKMKTASIIHLATHGLLDYGIPEVSLVRDIPGAIALAPDAQVNTTGGDGFLTANEIMNFSLQAELVVLSACNTGRGEITADGVMGLSRAFMTAGVPSVVVSLWAVPDAPTSMLMAEFYLQLKQTSDKAQALRHAMLATLQTYPNPIDWAAFTLIGEAH